MWNFVKFQVPNIRMNLPLAILYYAGKISGKVRFQKLVFLCIQEGGVPTEYGFKLHKFGPFSEDLSKDLQGLAADKGILMAEEVTWSSAEGPSAITVYSLTKSGRSLAEAKILPAFDADTKSRIQEVVQRYNNLPLPKLLAHVYSAYA
jgi:uncharacterized protein YwgA